MQVTPNPPTPRSETPQTRRTRTPTPLGPRRPHWLHHGHRMVTPRTTRCQTLDSITTQTTAYKGRCLFTPARVRERAGEVRTVAPYSRGIVGPTVYFGPSGTDIGRVDRCHGRLTQSLVLF